MQVFESVRIERGGHSAVKQRCQTDCGIAVMAWLTGRPWENCREAIFGAVAKKSYRTRHDDIAAGIHRLGFVAGKLR